MLLVSDWLLIEVAVNIEQRDAGEVCDDKWKEEDVCVSRDPSDDRGKIYEECGIVE